MATTTSTIHNVADGISRSQTFYDLEIKDRPGGNGKWVFIQPPGKPYLVYSTLYLTNEQIEELTAQLRAPNTRPCHHPELSVEEDADHFLCRLCGETFTVRPQEEDEE